ncbi:hypothetical protein Dred_2621 [Desulforamulus reducens MI-1]|uniref:Sporulation initiation factor Spo0A C-terminal domain-containing protein n=1 Tax=Desulforamulus reducens (strain ATCC BAA-1160 / DSM 100696 / MI-1) TaxID=349161 RepID=A4J7S8_DESRM|nr:sporulation initiation factor Spo0A C-terminal domain-containing protein [Desulforamulus reducens]ABO51131.1 hypothetical protein Dred_2621 [Desulforamulus reducens MI-1]
MMQSATQQCNPIEALEQAKTMAEQFLAVYPVLAPALDGQAPISEPTTVERPVASIDDQITQLLWDIGIPSHVQGYHYARSAIKLIIENRTMKFEATKKLYPAVATEFNTTPSSRKINKACHSDS